MFKPNLQIINSTDERERYLAEKEVNIEKARKTIENMDAMKKEAEADLLSGVYDVFARRNRGGKL